MFQHRQQSRGSKPTTLPTLPEEGQGRTSGSCFRGARFCIVALLFEKAPPPSPTGASVVACSFAPCLVRSVPSRGVASLRERLLCRVRTFRMLPTWRHQGASLVLPRRPACCSAAQRGPPAHSFFSLSPPPFVSAFAARTSAGLLITDAAHCTWRLSAIATCRCCIPPALLVRWHASRIASRVPRSVSHQPRAPLVHCLVFGSGHISSNPRLSAFCASLSATAALQVTRRRRRLAFVIR